MTKANVTKLRHLMELTAPVQDGDREPRHTVSTWWVDSEGQQCRYIDAQASCELDQLMRRMLPDLLVLAESLVANDNPEQTETNPRRDG